MNKKEIMDEVQDIKMKIVALPEGSVKIGELTVALVVLYDQYVRVVEKDQEAA